MVILTPLTWRSLHTLGSSRVQDVKEMSACYTEWKSRPFSTPEGECGHANAGLSKVCFCIPRACRSATKGSLLVLDPEAILREVCCS